LGAECEEGQQGCEEECGFHNVFYLERGKIKGYLKKVLASLKLAFR